MSCLVASRGDCGFRGVTGRDRPRHSGASTPCSAGSAVLL
jgi:hypothetical protein